MVVLTYVFLSLQMALCWQCFLLSIVAAPELSPFPSAAYFSYILVLNLPGWLGDVNLTDCVENIMFSRCQRCWEGHISRLSCDILVSSEKCQKWKWIFCAGSIERVKCISIGKLQEEVLCEVCLEGSSKQLELCLGWLVYREWIWVECRERLLECKFTQARNT